MKTNCVLFIFITGILNKKFRTLIENTFFTAFFTKTPPPTFFVKRGQILAYPPPSYGLTCIQRSGKGNDAGGSHNGEGGNSKPNKSSRLCIICCMRWNEAQCISKQLDHLCISFSYLDCTCISPSRSSTFSVPFISRDNLNHPDTRDKETTECPLYNWY